MDALIMAAGRGSRLGSHTEDLPKALVDLGGMTPLGLQLDLLARRGVGRAVLVTGYRAADIEAAARRHDAAGMRVECVWNPFWPIVNVAGSAWMARERLEGAFVYLHADTVFHPSILDDLLRCAEDACLPIDFRTCEPEQMKARVVDGQVVHLSKDLADDETAGEFIGIGVFRGPAVAQVRTGLDAVLGGGGFSEYFEAALNAAIGNGLRIHAHALDGRPWTEIDFPEDLAYARTILGEISLG